MHFSIDRTVHTTAFDKPVVDHWLERKIHIIKDYSDNEDTNYRVSPLHGLLFFFFLTSTYHSFCYTSCGALAVLRNNSMGPL